MAISRRILQNRIRDFVVENFLFGAGDGLDSDTSFAEEGIIDSTGVLELLTFIEETFNLHVDDDELIPENFDSINNITVFIEQKMP